MAGSARRLAPTKLGANRRQALQAEGDPRRRAGMEALIMERKRTSSKPFRVPV